MTNGEKKFDSFGIIIARTASVYGNAQQAMELALDARQKGKAVGIYLFSDGIWNALKNSGPVSDKLQKLLESGGMVFASNEHALAGGLPKDRAIEGIVFVDDAYDNMVDLVMEKWDKVIIC